MPILMQITNDIVQKQFSLSETTLSIGRGIANDIQLDDKTVSAHHAWLEWHPADDERAHSGYRLIDLKSTNGCFINEEKVLEQDVRHNDIVRIGFIAFRFVDEDKHRFAATSKVHKSWIPGVYYTKGE
ncbi:FHA domain-containing protein [Reinekea sp.]|jgi:pSer/pThr/pTyr-binding forkhead associated (FHA) protein|uniref:FHA domain-containing protein n=1 Tax=Reinekea sp. TaxID=1970455 RepID=UPI002A80A7EA|nr:FHA domain-containing protein [Reinekea sp.]